MTNQRLHANGGNSCYPDTVWPGRHSELAAVKQALSDGLDPNVLWGEEALVIPEPKGGCVLPTYI